MQVPGWPSVLSRIIGQSEVKLKEYLRRELREMYFVPSFPQPSVLRAKNSTIDAVANTQAWTVNAFTVPRPTLPLFGERGARDVTERPEVVEIASVC
jgi:hypothetical protein